MLRISEDNEATGPFSPGEWLYVLTKTKTSLEGRIAVPVVSPVRLAVHTAIRAADRAAELRASVRFHGDRRTKEHRNLASPPGDLFDFFEEAMTAAVFSYFALESFANETVERSLSGTFELERRDGRVLMDSAEIQKTVSTEEKLATVLPGILGVARVDKGKGTWNHFKRMKRVRDAATHTKADDHQARGGAEDKDSLFYHLLTTPPRRYPKTAVALLAHFDEDGARGWLAEAAALMP